MAQSTRSTHSRRSPKVVDPRAIGYKQKAPWDYYDQRMNVFRFGFIRVSIPDKQFGQSEIGGWRPLVKRSRCRVKPALGRTNIFREILHDKQTWMLSGWGGVAVL